MTSILTTTTSATLLFGRNASVSAMKTNVKSGQLSTEAVQQIVLQSFFILVALIGNGSVLFYLFKSKTCHRPVSIFVMSLAITDTLIALFSMSTEIVWVAFDGWIFGNFLCKLSTYVQCLLFASTAFILMSMSFDRYEAICKPMAFTRTISRSRKMIMFSWALAMIVAIPQIFIFVQVEVGQYVDGSPKYTCKSGGYTDEWQRKVYVTWLAAYVFVIPLFFVAFCYIKIAMLVWRTTNQPVHVSKNGEAVMLRRNNVTVDGSVERAKVKTIQITICILTCYIFCWSPYFTMTLLNVWTDYKYRNDIPSAVKTLAQCMAWFSSCANPIIYASFNIPHKSLRMICCKSSSKTSYLLQTGAITNCNSRRPTAVESHLDANYNLMVLRANHNYPRSASVVTNKNVELQSNPATPKLARLSNNSLLVVPGANFKKKKLPDSPERLF